MNNDIVFFISLNIKYILYFFFVIILVDFLPSLEVHNSLYNTFYSQENFNTRHLEISKLFVYLLTIIVGYGICSHTNFRKERKNVFLDGKGRYRDVCYLVLFSFFIFFTSANSVLVGFSDYEGFCDEEGNFIINLHKSK